MAVPTKIQHPLLRRPGTSQRKRLAGSHLLRPEIAPIDGRKLGDMLDFVYEYARLVVFHEYRVDAAGQGDIKLSNWLGFFKRSLPFTLNRFAKSDFDRLETDLRSTIEAIEQMPNDASLRQLLDFCYFDLITPLGRLQQSASEFDFERLVTLLDRTARTSLLPPLRRFIELNNVATKYFCTTKYDFMAFAQAPWDIPIEELFVTDETVKDVPGGQAGVIAWLGAEVAKAAQRFVVVQRNIAQEIPGLLNASIDVLEKRNDPHLGLLYAFLRLFEHFQGQLNGLTQKHLEFFYTEVLRLKRRDMVPDQAHLVFEPAKHLKSHLIEQGTRFKDAKDSKNVDILFGLDEEIVIDKAKVLALKTLFLNHSQGCLEGIGSSNVPRSFVEGVYIAPVSNSADGKGGEFKEEQSKNWSTLGAKLSKYTTPGEVAPQNHPFGRIGFILASPVLWLNEGRRTVNITITCDASNISDVEAPGNPDVSTQCFKEFAKKTKKNGENTDPKPFSLEFSGEEGWFKPKGEVDFELEVPEQGDQTVDLIFDVTLGINEPAVDFYDEEKIGEFFAAGPDDDRAAEPCPFPMVKIELDPEFRLQCESDCATDECCLTKKNSVAKVEVDFYHFLRHLKIKTLDIDVKVCGVKNLIVQNEESLQDVDSPFLPFGARPKVGAEFFVGSKEMLCKDWEKFWLHFNWKDKPSDLEDHYKFYCNEDLEEDCKEIRNDSFKFKAAVLEGRLWKERQNESGPISELIFEDRFVEAEKDCLEEKKIPFGQEIGVNDSSYYQEFLRDEFPDLKYEPKSLKPGALEPLSVNSDKGFFRMTLDGMSFQHDRYPYVLARKMIILSGGLDPNSVDEMRRRKDVALAVCTLISDNIGKLLNVITDVGSVANTRLIDLQNSLREKLDQVPKSSDPVLADFINKIINGELYDPAIDFTLRQLLDRLTKIENGIKTGALNELDKLLDKTDDDVGLPKEPYTPLIKSLEVDYRASADKSDIELIHLHPFPKTSKTETLFNVETLKDYAISLRSVLSLSDLPDQKKSLVIVSLVDPNRLHVRIFDDKEKVIVDKTEAELVGEQTQIEQLKKNLAEWLKADSDPSESLEAKKKIGQQAISISTQTTLLPTFTDEGTLFIGLEGLRPRSNLHLLFQFAEATADSESDRAEINWHYLVDNQWKKLRTGFELLSDETEQMTCSGIVKISLPEDISNEGNTRMPPTDEGQHLFWLKVSAPRAVAGVAELVGVDAQAALATYKPLDGSDLDRVAKPVEPEQIGKTLEPDFGIKKIDQPYNSFGGRVAEAKGTIPIRMSELLRHKGRSVDAFDIEHLVLDAFPELFKCKCISHTMGLSARQYQRDLEVAPGFLIVAVVPDLTKLEPGDMLEPMAPVSTLTKVKKFLKARGSPFARIRVKNPRYEQVHMRVKVRLRQGRDESYYLSLLKTDLRHFLAPWHLGDSDKLSFGQHLVYSDVLGFIEGLEYIDHVADLRLFDFRSPLNEQDEISLGLKEIVPLTARSILSPGDIEIKTDHKDCSELPASQSNEYTLSAYLESSLPRTGADSR